MRTLPEKTALRVSLAVIALVWIYTAARNIFFLDDILRTFESMPRVVLQAALSGLFVILAVTLLLALSGERYGDIGFKKQGLLRQLGTGGLFGLLIFILDTIVLSPVLDAILPPAAGQQIDMGKLFNSGLFPVFVLITLFKGGLCEELWRVFILTRFEKAMGGAGLVAALILSSMVFGMGHRYQGPGGMISIGLIGLLFALVYLRKRRALEAVFAHAAFNLIQVVLGFIVYSGKS